VVVARRTGLPLATLALHLRLGSAADPDGRSGLASLTAQLRTKGARHQGRLLGATDIARQAEALGSVLESGADWRGTVLTMTVASTRLDAAAALIADATLQPTLADAELERLRAQTSDDLKLSLTDPMALAGLAARRAWWGSSVFGGAMTPASLARIGAADIRAFARQQLRPELATLVISGDVTLADAVALAQRHLGRWPSLPMAMPASRDTAASPASPATLLVNLPGAGQSGVVVMAPSVGFGAEDRRVAQVAAAVLGGGYSARLNKEVRIKRGLSYGASAGSEFQSVGGVLSAQTQTNNATAAEVVGLLKAEITGMGQSLPEPDEMAARQATLVGNFGRQIETTGGLTAVAVDLIARGRPLSDAQTFAPQVMAVTAVQVRDFAARHWTAGSLRSVVVGDIAAAGDALKVLDPKALVLDASQLDLESARLAR
jgi:zinc protease